MVTAVTVTIYVLSIAGGRIKAHREEVTRKQGERPYLSIVFLYPNNCLPKRKRLCAYTLFQALQKHVSTTPCKLIINTLADGTCLRSSSLEKILNVYPFSLLNTGLIILAAKIRFYFESPKL